MGCLYMPLSRGRKRQNKWSAGATDMAFQSWTHRWMSPPSDWWDPRLPKRNSETYTTKCINSEGYRDPHPVGQSGWRNWLPRWCPPQKTAGVERGQTTPFGEAWSGRHPASQEKNPKEGEKGHLHWDRPCCLAEVRESHWRDLSTAATLEDKIERLSQSITWSQPDTCTQSRSHDHQRGRSQGQSRRCCRVWLEESPAPFFEYSPPQWGPEPGEDRGAKLSLLDFDLEPLLELGPEVDHFLQELAGSSEEENTEPGLPQNPPVEEYERWVTWQAWVHNTPAWWPELAKIPEVNNHQELAQMVHSSFELPQWISEWHGMENYHQATPAPLSICQKDFLPQHDSKFDCQDMRELQLEKMVAYAQALQFWVEKQSAYPRQTMPFGREHLRVKRGNEMLHFLSQWCWFWQCVPPRWVPDDPVRENHSWGCPASAYQLPCWRVCCEGYWGGSSSCCGTCRGVQYFPDTKWGTNQKGTIPKSIPWVEGGVTPLQTGHCCWGDPSYLSRFQVETS